MSTDEPSPTSPRDPLRVIRPGRVRVAAARLRSGRSLTLAPPQGARLQGAFEAADGLLTRYVLIDVPRYTARERLEVGAALGAEILDLAAEREGAVAEPGDAVLVRTGLVEDGGASLALHVREWLIRREIVLLATDAPRARVESGREPPDEAGRAAPVPLGLGFALEALARACAEDGEYAGLLAIPPFAAGEPHVSALALR